MLPHHISLICTRPLRRIDRVPLKRWGALHTGIVYTRSLHIRPLGRIGREIDMNSCTCLETGGISVRLNLSKRK